ncbi:hypothetical protein FM036_41070 [Nostoc sp. HG1]|nr:hypothetical protein [Nostoc sp. HG1]
MFEVEALLSNWSLTEEVDNKKFTSEKGKNFLFLSEESVDDNVEPITHLELDDSQDNSSTLATQPQDSTQPNIFTLIQAWSGEESDAATDSPFLPKPPNRKPN